MKTKREILKAAVPVERPRPGIYFLIREGRIIYVGQSVHVLARIGDHFATKQFDSWSWLECGREELNALERAYINKFMPEENRDSKTRRLRGPDPSPIVDVDPLGAASNWKVDCDNWPIEEDAASAVEAEEERQRMATKMAALRAMRRCVQQPCTSS